MNIARGLIPLAFALGAAACGTQQPIQTPAEPWVDYRPWPGRIGATFPAEPRQSRREDRTPDGGAIVTNLQEVEIDGRYYGTSWVKLAKAPSDEKARAQVLDSVVAGAQKSIAGAALIERQTVVRDAIEGRAFTLALPSGQRLRQLAYVVQDEIVRQTYSGPAGSETDANAERFFASLALFPDFLH